MKNDIWKPKASITKIYREWEKKASPEELQKFCDDANALAVSIQLMSKSRK
jgi:hypothetical protein